MQQLHARDVVGVLQYLDSNMPTFATPLWGYPRNLQIEPLSVEELRSMTRQMDVTQLRSFTAARAASREMPKAKPAPRPAGRGMPEAERHARAKVKAKAKSHQGTAGSASDQAYGTTDTADTGAHLDGTPRAFPSAHACTLSFASFALACRASTSSSCTSRGRRRFLVGSAPPKSGAWTTTWPPLGNACL